MSPGKFQKRVQAALALVPEEFRPYLENLEIVIEDWPEEEGLYGLYSGTPLPERHQEPPLFPAQITIYRGPLLEDFPDPEELDRQVAITVLHEIAHHLGIDEDRLGDLGLD